MTDADRPWGVFDIECQDWDTFVIGATFDGTTLNLYRDADKMIDKMLEGGIWYGHNAGRYDSLWFMAELDKRKIESRQTIAGSRILRVEVGSCTVADSLAFIPMGLAKAAKIAGESKAETGLPCVCGKKCGGYCSIRKDMSEPSYKIVAEYLAQDCRALQAVISFLQEYSADNGIELRGTIGSSAWNTAKAWLDLPTAGWTRAEYNMARDGYFGGRVEVFRPQTDHGWRYDIHSSYPAALKRTAIPIGECTVRDDPKAARAAWRKHLPGIYHAKVHVPLDTLIPPLPVRTEDRLAFPVGSFFGAWTEIELRYAMEQGAKVTELCGAITWDTTDKIMAPFCDKVWKLRDREAKAGNKELATWIKWLANSITGKFAMKPEVTACRTSAEDPGDGWSLAHPHGNVWFTTMRRYHACGHVQWSAYLTSEARIELHRQLLAAGENAIYCDTDSVYSRRELTRRIGDDLGEWGCEGKMQEWIALAPKLYRYLDQDGKPHVRGKGLSGLTSEGFDKIAAGGTWDDERGVLSFKQAARAGKGLFVRRTLSRKLSDPTTKWYGGRKLIGDSTVPATLIDLMERG